MKNIVVPIELLENVLDELYELKGERSWWKDEPRCEYKERYEELLEEISSKISISLAERWDFIKLENSEG